MNRQTGMIITIVVAVLTLCCSFSCCLFGILTLAGTGTYTLGAEQGAMPPAAGIPFICLGLLAWALPVALWFFLVRNKADDTTPSV